MWRSCWVFPPLLPSRQVLPCPHDAIVLMDTNRDYCPKDRFPAFGDPLVH